VERFGSRWEGRLRHDGATQDGGPYRPIHDQPRRVGGCGRRL